jgi:tRNA (guanine37-N1)-methyltransferase
VVPRERAETVRRELLAAGLLRRGLAIAQEGGLVYLPVTAAPPGHATAEREFRESFTPIRSYKDVARVPEALRASLPTSFDVVGDIAIVKIPEELAAHETAIAEAILQAHANVKVVAGPDRTETVHREHGLSYKVDVARAYFSPRLGSERMRVAEQVESGEAVVDMFAGVGPYAILIARRRHPRVVYAFDANPDAFRYLEENVRRNRATLIEPRSGDALGLLAAIEPPDRIIVDYPQNPEPAFRAALARVLPGGVIHCYAILETVELEDRERNLVATAEALDRGAEVLGRREVHGWSPAHQLVAFDVRVT